MGGCNDAYGRKFAYGRDRSVRKCSTVSEHLVDLIYYSSVRYSEKSTMPPHSTLSHTPLSTTTLTYSSQVPAVSLVLSVSSVTLPLTTSHSASSTHAVQSIKTQSANAPVHAAVSGPPPSKPPSQPAPAKAIAPPSQQPAASNGGSSSGGGSDNSVENSMLSAHNSFRASHGAPAMTWSNNLAAAAQSWANGCKFKHSGGTLGPFGGSYYLSDFSVPS